MDKPRAKKKKPLSPLHPVIQTQIVREQKERSLLMEFISTVEGEMEYREAILEFQEEWCDHPADDQEVISTRYAPTADHYEHRLMCNVCGRLVIRQGRARAKD